MQDLGKFYIKMGKFERAAQMLFCCTIAAEKKARTLESYTLNLNAYKCKERSGKNNNKK